MARNHFRCPTCEGVTLITYRAAEVDGAYWPPGCLVCGTPLELAPQPGDFSIDAHSDGGTDRSFQKFSIDVDGTRTEIDSLHTLRRVERESEQRYRNGEGEPLRFRAWSQDPSNRDVGSFGTAGRIGERTYDSGAAPAPRPKKVGVTRHGERKPRVTLGPGLSRAATPLKGSDA